MITLSGNRKIDLSSTPVMGVLNVTPDSFSDGGEFVSVEKALEKALVMETEGAAIIDIGGESSRPGAKPVSQDEELDRVLPVIKAIREKSAIPLSIDTVRSVTAQKALETGADIINDISAFRSDSEMVEVAAKYNSPVILMHMLGTPDTMQVDPSYVNCIKEIKDFFEERINFALQKGIDRTKIIIDPGIGFGKRLSDNLEIIKKIDILKELNQPVLIGTSRKSFINMIHPTDIAPAGRIGGSIASTLIAVLNGADIVRVHDVREIVEAIKVVKAIKETE